MMHPSLDSLMGRVDNKYTLVVIAAKRGRELLSGHSKLIESRASKSVTVALEEIDGGLVMYERTREGIK
jgi:DNA-directed RNA polymerase subunit omega